MEPQLTSSSRYFGVMMDPNWRYVLPAARVRMSFPFPPQSRMMKTKEKETLREKSIEETLVVVSAENSYT